MLSRRHLLTLAGAGAVLAGCSRQRLPTLRRLTESHHVRVGVSGEEPYSFLDSSGNITGESPQVARAVLRGLGVTTMEAVQRPFGQLIDALLDGAFDIMAAGASITPPRCARVAFSQPDFVASTAFLVKRGNPLRLLTFGSVARANVPIAVLGGSVEQDAARASGIPEKMIKAYGSQSTLFQAVFEGTAPVGALTDISLRNALGRQPKSGLELTAGVARGSGPSAGAFAFRPADTDLRDAFNVGLGALHRSGEWLRIAQPFGVSAINLPGPDLTAERLCQPT